VTRDTAESVSAKLEVVAGNDEGRTYNLSDSEVVVGRGAQSDFVLADLAVSRKHVAVIYKDGGYVLADQGSGNGTKVNGVRVTTHILKDGDEIKLGKTVLRFVSPETGGQDNAIGAGPAAVEAAPAQPQPAPAQPQPAPAQRPAPAPAQRPMPAQPQRDLRGPGPGRPPSPGGMASTLQVDPRPAGIEPRPDASPPTGSVMPPAKAGKLGFLKKLTDTKPKKILVFGGLGVVLLLMVLAMVAKVTGKGEKKKPKQAATQQAPTADQLYAEGKKLIQQGKWDDAERLFLKLSEADPKNPFIKTKLELIRANQKARDDYQRAKKKFDEGNLVAAETLAKIVEESGEEVEGFRNKARKLLRKIQEKKADELLKEAAALKEDDKKKEEAIKKVKKALEIAPKYRPALVLQHELGAGPAPPPLKEGQEPREIAEAGTDADGGDDGSTEVASRASARPSARGRTRRSYSSHRYSRGGGGSVGGSYKKFKAFYKAKNWSAAAAELRRVAASAGGRKGKRLKAKASKVKQVGQAISTGMSNRLRNSVKSMKAFRRALRLDRQVSGGMHSSYIKGQLGKVARAAAGSAFSSGRYAQAYRAVKTARSYGGDNAALRRIMSQLDGKAKQLFSKGYVNRDSNLSKAKSYWRKVLRMVPSSSVWHKKAKWFLNNYGKSKGGGSADEDEL
jgi:tetratricopeptide (TPR) repeat protein